MKRKKYYGTPKTLRGLQDTISLCVEDLEAFIMLLPVDTKSENLRVEWLEKFYATLKEAIGEK